MGVSTDGILFWGIAYDDEDELPDGEELAASLWLDTDEFDLEEIAYTLNQNKRNTCTVGTHCSGECPMYFAAVSESVFTARRGCPVEVDSLAVGGSWEKRLKDFCGKMQLPWKEPKWWLASYWG